MQDSCNPTWQATLVFDTAAVLAAAAAGRVLPDKLSLQFEVWHADKLQAEEFLGQAKLSLR